ncbi:MAG TPA: pyrroloquinoline quinone biosynthesis protein PqqB [Candidatus Acidoferrales bacterium]|nr:pyrroloquinoline quinone biosynthesis protein PqqB [Candidatus Acidoferrales bacterium]
MKIKVLGSAAGGGFPQWNCGCSNCDRARRGLSGFRPRAQAQVAVSVSPGSWILLNASPDLRQQLLRDPDFAPAANTRATPVSTIVLTSADVDSVMGLLHLREFQPLRVFAAASVLRILTEENSLVRCLERSSPPISWEPLALDRAVAIRGLECEAIPLGGDYPDYVSAALRKSLAPEEAVIGLELAHEGRKFFYAPSISGQSGDWRRYANDADLALLDGTFWTDDELIAVRGSGKTAREIGHVPLSGTDGLLMQLAQSPAARKSRRVLIHLNNTNPVLDESSDAHRAVRDAGLEVAYDGMEIELP